MRRAATHRLKDCLKRVGHGAIPFK